LSRRSVATGLLWLLPLLGCEQGSQEWFPQMKKQLAVQAFEDRQGFLPPEGAVDVSGGPEPAIGRLDIAAADALVNPSDPRDFRSLQNGEAQYRIFCLPCHGATGMGDGPVSATNPSPGPFGGVFPLVGLTTSRSDGYLYNVIRLGSAGMPGFRMPAYDRIPSRDRWDLVNYVRYLDRKGGRP
jgi:mono/diheme cytochrome c family protein